MIRSSLVPVVIALTALATIAPDRSLAQGASPSDVLQRLRSAAARGDTVAGRHLADSLMSSSEVTPREAAEGSYWRGMLAGSADSIRPHLLRVVVEYPMATIAGDALYRLAQLDLADGNHAGAIRRLTRVNRDYGMSSKGADAAFELSQLLFTAGNVRDACAALDSALLRLPPEQVERRNRMAYSGRSCAQLEPEVPRSDSGRAPADSTATSSRGAARPPAARGTATAAARLWSAQAGAFANRPDADKLAARLKARGYDARVTGERPFRVRIGRFRNRLDATAIVNKLKAEKTAAILVEAERP